MFFQRLADFGEQIAVIQDQQALSYTQLAQRVSDFGAQLQAIAPEGRKLILLQGDNDLDTLVAYLAALQHKHALLLVDVKLGEQQLQGILEVYQPNVSIKQGQIKAINPLSINLHQDLALLLSTSGSTGSPKQVALSQTNLQANAESILAYLPIKASDKTLTTLPFAYSYGLSVINSHLLAGACVVLNKEPPTSRAFWQTFEQQQIASLAGVPYSWQMLIRLGFTRKAHPHLRYFTQAGGKLESAAVSQLTDYAQANQTPFFIMYGQTEATARMAYLDPQKLLQKPDSIGQPIPGGRFALKDQAGNCIQSNEQSGELYYQGANTMLGYTENQADLANFEPAEWLATGDLAYRDGECDYFINGRLKRIIKPFGQRINLDELEQWLGQHGHRAICIGNDKGLLVVAQMGDDERPIAMDIARFLTLNVNVIKVLNVVELPLLNNGKPDYQKARDLLAEHSVDNAITG